MILSKYFYLKLFLSGDEEILRVSEVQKANHQLRQISQEAVRQLRRIEVKQDLIIFLIFLMGEYETSKNEMLKIAENYLN